MCQFCENIEDSDDPPPIRRGRNYHGPFAKTPGRLLGMGLIRLYQLTLSSLVGSHCRHMPTCSEYGYEAIARHGLWTGGWLALFRVSRCGPGGTWGVDDVPASLARGAQPWQIWRLWQVGRKHRDSGSS